MKRLPYRVPATREIPNHKAERPADIDLILAAGLLLTASFVRVVGAFLHHETFGPEATLALVAVGGLPWIVLRRKRAKA